MFAPNEFHGDGARNPVRRAGDCDAPVASALVFLLSSQESAQ